jgi:hypothetical protein
VRCFTVSHQRRGGHSHDHDAELKQRRREFDDRVRSGPSLKEFLRPTYQASNRSKGKTTDREDLGMIESKIAYG